MTISMYSASVPMFQRSIAALAKVLEKGAAFAEAKKIEPSVLLQSRLAPDMFPLVRQVQLVSDQAKNGLSRLAGIPAPKFPDEETTFPELQERLAKTLAFLDGLTPAQLEGSETREIVLPMRGNELRFSGIDYLMHFVTPQVMFHCTTAYVILRHNGVQVGKRDFLGAA